MDDIESKIDDNSWITELETALLTDCDVSVIKKITNQKSVPDTIRYEYWQACLGVKGRTKLLEDVYDLAEQNQIRDDCHKLVEKLGNDESDLVSVQSDIESIITNYSKLTGIKYTSNNGWLETIEPLLALKLKRDELFKFFEAINSRYIPKCFHDDGTINYQPYHFLRLLLLYHDPELCSFMDTKKITPDLYATSWFRSLFSAHCNIKVTLALWDVYFSLSDSFLIFFLALVMLVNEKEQIMEMKDEEKESIINKIKQVPGALCLEDIGDLFYLVEQHYVSKTPRNIHKLSPLLFQSSSQDESLTPISDLLHLLCLPVFVADLLPKASNNNLVRYFVVDCRPDDQYNNGHLSNSFHLDCSLMLQKESAFNSEVQALLSAQKSLIDSKSGSGGGHHLCFMGSGREEEDQYVHMIVSSFLQKHHQFVSLAYGGYAALHKLIIINSSNELERYLVDHNRKKCLSCCSRVGINAGTSKKSTTSTNTTTNSNSSSLISSNYSSGESLSSSSTDVEVHFTSALFDKVANAVKTKTSEMKEKLVEYVTNPNHAQIERHVSAKDKIGKRYPGSKNRFLIDEKSGDEDGWKDGEDESGQEIDVNEWSKSPDVIGCYKCQEIKDDGYMCPSYLGLTRTHLFVLREIPHNKGYVKVIAKRPLEMIVQITSKKRCPDLITFRYGQTNDNSTNDNGSNDGSAKNQMKIFATDHLLISKPFEVTRLIKHQVIKILDGDVSSDVSTASSK